MSPHRPNDWSLESGGRYTEQRETESIAGFGRIPYTKTSEFAAPIARSESPAPRGRRPKPHRGLQTAADEAISSIVAEKGTRIGEDEQVKRYFRQLSHSRMCKQDRGSKGGPKMV
ncbi:hypothetical protein CGMCC3_g5964 [Colletotrichum fructicola]|uniref:Uncharacterized protein n=1 Tax=Colletotrichum fructicola (strain Nara gc5) TaxID=1213859 RepID=A0A7J6JDN0_COLFN|nr:uncharacterized protein CGMCC3_g5964 [Colletotrichum fructicola]KAE9577949.1 hypothetical protein CGMCC3_g5964 [Colletotrichum fructicola]KAF4425366.1 hypothetical protein CFRS1_v000464 [Colletotrichum fructicola]KAF4488397.1 hypothetical protein CGGC5_v004019 [Colletotrichum fructicola Nara gc5]